MSCLVIGGRHSKIKFRDVSQQRGSREKSYQTKRNVEKTPENKYQRPTFRSEKKERISPEFSFKNSELSGNKHKKSNPLGMFV